jgi:transcription-repair coupling factor (superfamily II helicase)
MFCFPNKWTRKIYKYWYFDFGHIDHGVGQFAGLQKIDVNGKEQEAIRLVYKGGDTLYVSIHSLHRISKYSGKEGTAPSMDRLGSPAWQNLKQKTKSKVCSRNNLSASIPFSASSI